MLNTILKPKIPYRQPLWVLLKNFATFFCLLWNVEATGGNDWYENGALGRTALSDGISFVSRKNKFSTCEGGRMSEKPGVGKKFGVVFFSEFRVESLISDSPWDVDQKVLCWTILPIYSSFLRYFEKCVFSGRAENHKKWNNFLSVAACRGWKCAYNHYLECLTRCWVKVAVGSTLVGPTGKISEIVVKFWKKCKIVIFSTV